MKAKKVPAFKGEINSHDVLIVRDEFREWLLIINGQTIGYIKPENIEGVINEATRYPRLKGLVE